MERVLRALLIKESWELAPWLFGCFIVFATGLLVILINFSDQVAQRVWHSVAIPQYMLLSAVFCPLIALIIGFAQFYRETKPGRIAIFVHRPISRTSLFLAKGSIGLLWYLVLTGVPLFCALYWLSKPYNAPYQFYWFMALPFLSDLLAGIPAYLAAAQIAYSFEGRARFSYAILLIIPFASAVLCYSASTFVQALLVTMLASALLLVSALGLSSAARGRGRQPLVARIPLAVMQYAALCFLGAVILLLMQNGYRSLIGFYPNGSQVRRAFLRDGTPILEVFEDARAKPRIFAYSDNLQLQAVDVDYQKTLPTPWLADRFRLVTTARTFHDLPAYASVYNRGTEILNWTLGPTGDYFVGYNLIHPSLWGAVGPDGFHPGVRVSPTRFDSPLIQMNNILWQKGINIGWDPVTYFAAGNAIWAFNPENPYRVESLSIHPIFTLPSPEPIVAAMALQTGADSNGYLILPESKLYVVLRTASTLYILTPDNGQLRLLTSYQNLQLNMANLQIGLLANPDRFVIQSSPGPLNKLPTETEVRVVYLTTNGTTTRELVLPPSPFEERETEPPVLERALFAATLPSPASFTDAFYQLHKRGAINDTWTHIPRSQPKQMELGLSMVSAGFCALLAWLYGRKFLMPLPWLVAWTLGVLLLGIPGVVLMVLTYRLPAIVSCPSCQKKRLASAEKCPHCGAGFPAAPVNGTEVFA